MFRPVRPAAWTKQQTTLPRCHALQKLVGKVRHRQAWVAWEKKRGCRMGTFHLHKFWQGSTPTNPYCRADRCHLRAEGEKGRP
ncbi:unnamed protein product [Zymoseptoria tritici ST99CH_3D7]|uniref:Uncharacterized protein n=1 Tax=Zymoseptoria tritici (strain ST99CH_3D7) TaxID=1276538 RepID=A0A1X7RJZ2_ZYMT9|nr:unnamed protein product [Zymoseptoria tritici ST99CH_3D7]